MARKRKEIKEIKEIAELDSLSEKERAKFLNEILNGVIAGRIHAISKYPYLAVALSSIRLVKRPAAVPTAGVDKEWRFYWNPTYILTYCKNFDLLMKQVRGESMPTMFVGNIMWQIWDLRGLANLWVHEVSHLLFSHFERRGDRETLKWNYATDLEINDNYPESEHELLIKYGYLHPERDGLPVGLNAERYYEMIPDEKLQALRDLLGDYGEGSGVTGERAPWELDPNDEEYPGLTSEITKEAIKEETAKRINEYKQAGSVPLGWERWADSILNPKVDWREQLRSLIHAGLRRAKMGQTDYSFRRPNRKRHDSEFIFPSRIDYLPEIAVIVDTSGSMDEDDLAQAVGEVGAILQTVSGRIWFASADAEVHTLVEVSNIRDVLKNLKGGGGTDMGLAIETVIDWVKRRGGRVDVVIVLTDGYTPWKTLPPPVPVIVGVIGAHKVDVPDWAKRVDIEVGGGDGH